MTTSDLESIAEPSLTTSPIALRSSAVTRAWRTSGSEVGRSARSLNSISPTGLRTPTEPSLAPSRRLRSVPRTTAALISPESSRLAAVLSSVTTRISRLSGRPLVSLVTPFGPQA